MCGRVDNADGVTSYRGLCPPYCSLMGHVILLAALWLAVISHMGFFIPAHLFNSLGLVLCWVNRSNTKQGTSAVTDRQQIPSK